jgi:Sulfotransferase family
MSTSPDYKYVFVCGLARSGTSMLGRNIARLENCTGFKNTGALQDEGQFLQDIYPVAADLGGAGRFGFNPRAHRTEDSELLTPENVARLHASWHPYWDKSKTICVEKTPGNLLMTRFLQAAFPNSYFIVVKRHPVPVSMSSQRWKMNITSMHSMFEHWLHCHELFEQDKKYLKRLYELSYEDYIADSARYHAEIAAFIGTRVPEPPKEDEFYYVTEWRNPAGVRVPEHSMEEVSVAHNQKYFDRWSELLRNSPFRNYYRYIAKKYEPRFAKWGYSLTNGMANADQVIRNESKVYTVAGPLYCFGADLFFFCWRFGVRLKGGAKRVIKALLPQFVLMRIRRAREGTSRDQKRAGALSRHA